LLAKKIFAGTAFYLQAICKTLLLVFHFNCFILIFQDIFA